MEPNVLRFPTDPLWHALVRRECAKVEQLRAVREAMRRGEDVGCFTPAPEHPVLESCGVFLGGER